MKWQEQHTAQIDARNVAFYAFAERIITLSTGALALSIAFRHSFSQPIPKDLWLLRVSWIAFTIAILAAMLVQFGRVGVHGKLASGIRRAGEAGETGPVIALPGWWFSFASFVMLISFPMAIVALAIFALRNLQ